MRRRIVLCLTLLSACNPAPPPKATPMRSAAARPHAARTPLVLTIKGRGSAHRPVHLIQQVHNRIDYDLLASSYESKGAAGAARAVFQDARVTFRDPRGSQVSATAPAAVVDQSNNTVTLMGGVAATNSLGTTLQCRQLTYFRATGMLRGSGDVVVIDPKGFRASGTTFESDLSLTHMRMQ